MPDGFAFTMDAPAGDSGAPPSAPSSAPPPPALWHVYGPDGRWAGMTTDPASLGPGQHAVPVTEDPHAKRDEPPPARAPDPNAPPGPGGGFVFTMDPPAAPSQAGGGAPSTPDTGAPAPAPAPLPAPSQAAPQPPVPMPQQAAPGQPMPQQPMPQQPAPMPTPAPPIAPPRTPDAPMPTAAPLPTSVPSYVAGSTFNPPPPDPNAPGWGHTIGVGVGMFGRGAAKSIPGMIDLRNTIADAAGPLALTNPLTAGFYVSKLLGLDEGTIPRMLGLGENNAPLTSLVDKAYTALGGPTPQDADEQTLADYAEPVGTVAGDILAGGGLRALGSLGVRGVGAIGRALTAHPITQVASTLAGTQAARVVQQQGGSERAQMLANVLTGVGTGGLFGVARGAVRGLSALARSATHAGQVERAADQAFRASDNPQTLRARVQAGIANPNRLPDAPITAGQAAGDAELLRLEQAARGTREGSALADTRTQRNVAVGRALERFHQLPATDVEARGATIRSALRGHERAMDANVDRLYATARGASGTTSLRPLLSRLQTITQARFGPGSGGAPGVWRDISQQILTRMRAGDVTADWVVNMDRQIGDAAREAGRAGRNNLAGALRSLQGGLRDLNPAPELTAAKTARARMGRVLGRDETGGSATGDILKTDPYDAPTLTDGKVADRAIRDVASVRQVLDAGDEAIRQARANGASAAEIDALLTRQTYAGLAMREQFLDNLNRKIQGAPQVTTNAAGATVSTPSYSPAAWRKFLAQNRAVIEQLFTADERNRMARISEHFTADEQATGTARAPGSPTSQNISYLTGGRDQTLAHAIMAASGGTLDPNSEFVRNFASIVQKLITVGATHAGHLIAGTGGALVGEHMAEGVGQIGTDATRAMLFEALHSGETFDNLLSQASPAVLERVLRRSQRDGGPLWEAAKNLFRASLKSGVPAQVHQTRPEHDAQPSR